MKEPGEITHNSSKEERDYILEYQRVDLNDLSKTDILGVEFDNVSRDQAAAIIINFIKKKEKFHHILFIDPVKLMSFKSGKKLNRIPKKASLVLAESGGLRWAARQMGLELKEKISIISLMMDLIRYSEKNELTLFFLGSKEATIEKLFFNLIKHFPDIRIVGRHSGYLNQERELMVKEAIRKTSPDIIFLAMDFPEQEIWIENNTGYFGKSVVIGTWGSFDILSGKVPKMPEFFQANGLYWLWKVITRPWRIVKLWNTIKFFLLVKLAYFKNKKKNKTT